MSKCVLFGVMLLAGCQAASGDQTNNVEKWKPMPLDALCAKYECPKAEEKEGGSGYSARFVYGANWTGTDLDDVSNIEKSRRSAFMRLFRYISGANDQSAKIDMTIPVVNMWFLDENHNVTGGRMMFYLPAAHQAAPPLPTDSTVNHYQLPDMDMYYRAFGGSWVNQRTYHRQFLKLSAGLQAAGVSHNVTAILTLSYTRPGWGRQRHEVAFMGSSQADKNQFE